MFNEQARLAFALATLMAAALIFVQPRAAAAQVADVADAPISIQNGTNTDLSFEVIAVLRRNGTVTPVNVIYQVKAGANNWLGIGKNEKLSGVAILFLASTPGGQQVTRWDSNSHGAGTDGFFRVDFTKELLKEHWQIPNQKRAANLRAVPAAVAWHRGWLQRRITRVQAAIQQDEALIQRVGFGGDFLRILGNEADRAGKKRGEPGDELLGYLARRLGEEAARKAAQNIAAAQARIQANRQLLQRYNRELNPPLGPVRPPL